jgi:hypothetical protein
MGRRQDQPHRPLNNRPQPAWLRAPGYVRGPGHPLALTSPASKRNDIAELLPLVDRVPRQATASFPRRCCEGPESCRESPSATRAATRSQQKPTTKPLILLATPECRKADSPEGSRLAVVAEASTRNNRSSDPRARRGAIQGDPMRNATRCDIKLREAYHLLCRGVVLCAVCALAYLSLVSAAFAEFPAVEPSPWWLYCEKDGGLLKEKCLAVGAGGYIIDALKKGMEVGTTLSGGKTQFETAAGEIIQCEKNAGSGNMVGNKQAKKFFLTFRKCTLKGKECTTAGKAAGEIETSELKGEVIWINKAKTVSGLELEPVAQPFATFGCEGLNVKIKGEIIGKVTPVNVLVPSFTIAWKKVVGKKGKQEWAQVEEEGPIRDLEAEIGEAKGEEGALEVEDTITVESGRELGVGVGESPPCK